MDGPQFLDLDGPESELELGLSKKKNYSITRLTCERREQTRTANQELTQYHTRKGAIPFIERLVYSAIQHTTKNIPCKYKANRTSESHDILHHSTVRQYWYAKDLHQLLILLQPHPYSYPHLHPPFTTSAPETVPCHIFPVSKPQATRTVRIRFN